MHGTTIVTALMFVAAFPAAAGASPDEEFGSLPERLRFRLEQPPAALDVGEEAIHTTEATPRFYRDREYRLAWIRDGRPLPVAKGMPDLLLASADEGLRPEDYHLNAIRTLLAGARLTDGEQIDLELLLTDAFLLQAAHIVSGRLDPETFHPEWVAVRREVDLIPVLEEALRTGDLQGALSGLLPVHPEYARLRGALRQYRDAAAGAGWPQVPEGPALRKNDAGSRVAALRRRLAAAGEIPAGDSDRFDDDLDAAVRRFQVRHGLDPDGVVGSRTVAALNVGPAGRLRQIELNMERWRWLPRDLGRRHIIVNIPAFRLDAVESDRTALTMPVIVGRAYRRTPVFSDAVRYMVTNPFWEVPHRLAVQDKLPLIRKDRGYIDEEGFKVLQGWGADQREVDPASVDWASVGPRSFPYRLRQNPGPRNALGRIKFMFPNKFNVYLHDTPARELFAKAERDFSSGCIRVGDPLALAGFLLAGSEEWDVGKLEALMRQGTTRTVTVRPPVPVHLLYWTAWADDAGEIHFRRDLYGRDVELDAALSLPPPS